MIRNQVPLCWESTAQEISKVNTCQTISRIDNRRVHYRLAVVIWEYQLQVQAQAQAQYVRMVRVHQMDTILM